MQERIASLFLQYRAKPVIGREILVHLGDINGHRTIDVDGYIRDFSFLKEQVKVVQDHLGSPHCKGRNDGYSAVSECFTDCPPEFLFRFGIGLLSIAVGRFHQEYVCKGNPYRRIENGVMVPAQVTGKNDFLFLIFSLDF